MPVWTGKTRKAIAGVDEAYLLADSDSFLDIGGGNKLIIQAAQSNTTWTAQARAD